jgi:hypothetical protein
MLDLGPAMTALSPLTQARLASMSPDERKRAVTAVIGRVVEIVDRHAAATGKALKLDRTPTDDWFLFGVRLSSAVISHTRVLSDPTQLASLRGLFAEIFDLLMVAYDGAPCEPIAELMRAFGSGIECGPVLKKLLPDRAQPVVAEADRLLERWADDERQRADQSGY